MAKIHQEEGSCFGKIGSANNNVGAENYYMSYFENTIQLVSSFDIDLARKIDDFVKMKFNANFYANMKPVLLHNDFHLKNVIASNNKKIKFIDWDCSKYAHSELDFLKLSYLVDKQFSRDNLTSIFDGYRSKRELEITPNYIVHQVVWFAKMLAFEKVNPIKEHSYFPSMDYYRKQILYIVENADKVYFLNPYI